jgi:hypothetical protein
VAVVLMICIRLKRLFCILLIAFVLASIGTIANYYTLSTYGVGCLSLNFSSFQLGHVQWGFGMISVIPYWSSVSDTVESNIFFMGFAYGLSVFLLWLSMSIVDVIDVSFLRKPEPMKLKDVLGKIGFARKRSVVQNVVPVDDDQSGEVRS